MFSDRHLIVIWDATPQGSFRIRYLSVYYTIPPEIIRIQNLKCPRILVLDSSNNTCLDNILSSNPTVKTCLVIVSKYNDNISPSSSKMAWQNVLRFKILDPSPSVTLKWQITSARWSENKHYPIYVYYGIITGRSWSCRLGPRVEITVIHSQWWVISNWYRLVL